MIRDEFFAFLGFGIIVMIFLVTGIVDIKNSYYFQFLAIYPIVLIWIVRHIKKTEMKKKEYENFFYNFIRRIRGPYNKADEREKLIGYKTTHFSVVIMIFFLIPIYGLRNEVLFGGTITELLIKFNVYDIWGWILLSIFYIIWGITGLFILKRES